MLKGSKQSEASRLKMSLSRRGRKQTPEHIENLRKARLGQKRPSITGEKNPRFGKHLSEEAKERISNANTGRKMPPMSLESRYKLSEMFKGEKGPGWKGGVTRKHTLLRMSLEYKLWREVVYKRDNWTCVWCKVRGGKLNADHIKPFAYFPELRFAIDNGRTLCETCHRTTDTYGVH